MVDVGRVCEITRYPVKSMAGIAAESATLGWHGLEGDRRFAFRRIGEDNDFPWLSASKLPELVLYRPVAADESSGSLPTHVLTPSGSQLELDSPELVSEIASRLGNGVELMQLKHGIFDEAPIAVISLATIHGIGREAGVDGVLDRRRFRMNIVLETESDEPFLEDAWIGRTLMFGDSERHGRLARESTRKIRVPRSPAVHVTMPDLRCVMLNIDPDTAVKDARVMKTVARLNQNNAGVYATVVRTGVINVGDRVSLL